MAATLANGGMNPFTRQRAVVRGYVECMLSVMCSCGMYDAAGEWIYQVGIPAKSGVTGGILAVLPGQLGIGVFSPLLDPRGNSVRGIEVCRELSQSFNLHLFNSSNPARSVIRSMSTAADVGSKRIRSNADQALLQKQGSRVRHLNIQGDLQFTTAERVVRETLREAEMADHLLLNLKHVRSMDFVAVDLIARLATCLAATGKSLALTGSTVLSQLRKSFAKSLPADTLKFVDFFDDYEIALETLEDRLIAGCSKPDRETRLLEPEECELLANLDNESKRLLHGLLSPRSFAPSECIIEEGATDRSIFFILRGSADVWIKPIGQDRLRVASFSAGMALGELALLDASPRSATVLAHTQVDCVVLSETDFEFLEREHPRIGMGILRNLALVLARRLRKANTEISAAHSA